jgi:two-component system cell cycle response regulator DivK
MAECERPGGNGLGPEDPPDPEDAQPNLQAAHAGECILIIEDNPLNMKLFRDVLRSQGYQVLEARDGRSGVDLALAEHPDLILLDLHLPDMSGLAVAAELKADERTQDIPILVLTASMVPEAQHAVLASGCDAFLTKPIALPQFRATVASLLKRRRLGSRRERSL